MIPGVNPYMDTGPRGCGRRKQGGVYAELPLSPHGRPVEDFLICPPKLLSFDVPAVGMMPVQAQQAVHLIDWVGREFYPNVVDFIEEVRRMGLSRRLPSTLPFDQLTAQSRLLCVHARAHIHNPDRYTHAERACPQRRPAHDAAHPDQMCGRLWWADVEGGVPQPTLGLYAVECQMPSFAYLAQQRPDGIAPEYSPAIFAAFPIARLAVVRGDAGEHEPVVERLQTLDLNLPWEVVDE